MFKYFQFKLYENRRYLFCTLYGEQYKEYSILFYEELQHNLRYYIIDKT